MTFWLFCWGEREETRFWVELSPEKKAPPHPSRKAQAKDEITPVSPRPYLRNGARAERWRSTQANKQAGEVLNLTRHTMNKGIAALLAVGLLVANGVVAGVLSHRWERWEGEAMQAQAARLDAVPRQVGEWDGTPIDANPHDLPEDEVGRGVSIRYVNRTDGTAVVAYIACGPTESSVGHCPTACYPATGYTWNKPDVKVALPGDDSGAQFWVSHFTRPVGDVPVQVRIFWAWSDGSGWRVPGNPLREFRRDPLLYKCYFIRQVRSANEPVEGDPCLRLMAALVPAINTAIATAPTQ